MTPLAIGGSQLIMAEVGVILLSFTGGGCGTGPGAKQGELGIILIFKLF